MSALPTLGEILELLEADELLDLAGRMPELLDELGSLRDEEDRIADLKEAIDREEWEPYDRTTNRKTNLVEVEVKPDFEYEEEVAEFENAVTEFLTKLMKYLLAQAADDPELEALLFEEDLV